MEKTTEKTMNKVVILAPGKVAEAIDFEAATVSLNDLHRLTDCSCVDVSALGRLPTGDFADMWFDDEGLLNDAKPNRRAFRGDKAGPVICGTILICARTPDGDSRPLTEDEAAFCMKHVAGWDILAPVSPKPEPKIEFTPINREAFR